jgi:hypothetical protein
MPLIWQWILSPVSPTSPPTASHPPTLTYTQEFAEATAEEASKKIKNLNLHDTLGAGISNEAAHPPSIASLEAYGITPDLLNFIRTLSFATFSDFPSDQLAPLSSTSQSITTPIDSNTANVVEVLNSWQVRHASLVVKAAKEVNELRFVLCPRYMKDARFWHIYFTLIKKYLPEEAYTWKSGDDLPEIIIVRSNPTSTSPKGDTSSGGGISFAALGSQLKQFSSKMQIVAQQTANTGKLELSTLKLALSSSATTGTATAPPLTTTITNNTESTSTQKQQPSSSSNADDNTLLGNDPDLEAYLKELALPEGDDNNDDNDNEGGGPLHQDGEVGDDDLDLDLDKYLEELTGGGGG